MKSQPDHITALDLPIPSREQLTPEFQKYFAICDEKLGMVPNVLKAYSQNAGQLEAFSRLYNELMFGDSNISELEKEMIAVVVSSENSCYYCQVAHGAAVREYADEPKLGELMVMNYRVAPLEARQRAMLDFAAKMTKASAAIEEADREVLRQAGFSDRDIWDIANVTGFFNMTNRVASATAMAPNEEYHAQFRE